MLQSEYHFISTLGRHHGYVFYEADMFLSFTNPFIDPTEDGMKPMQTQRHLKGVPKEAFEASVNGLEMFKQMQAGIFDKLEENLAPMYKQMGEHIKKQKERLGGNFVIAQAVFSRNQRKTLQNLIGPDLIFIVLNMSKECQMKRVKIRHGDAAGGEFGNKVLEIYSKYAELCEPAAEDEENSYNITITDDMSREDVIEKILNIVKKI